MSDALYQEYILDHYRSPRCVGTVEHPTFTCRELNPACGDEISVSLAVDENGVITDALWTGQGCAISQASASLLFETLRGKMISDVMQMGKDDILDLLGVDVGPSRIRCALLALRAVQASNK